MGSDSKLNAKDNIWTKYEVPKDNPLKISIGPLNIWCITEKKELRIAWNYTDYNSGSGNPALPEETVWQRWAFKNQNPRIELKPVFPDRPILVKPENPFKVAEDASVRVYVRVPVWVRINLLGKTITNLVEIPVVTLSNTWFGSFQEGDLCYWISSGARLAIKHDPERPYMVICPLQLVDRSPEDLNVEKICLRVENLSIFSQNNQLWADETKIIYRGYTEVSKIEIKGTAPAEIKEAKILSEPRVMPKKSLTAKTFSTFKDLPGFGFFSKE